MPRSRPATFTIITHQGDRPPDVIGSQFIRPEANNAPTGQRGFEVFLQIDGKPCTAIVAAVDVDAALNLNQGPAGLVWEVGPPAPGRVVPCKGSRLKRDPLKLLEGILHRFDPPTLPNTGAGDLPFSRLKR